MNLFDYNKLNQFAKDNHTAFKQADPYPHIVLDNFSNSDELKEVIKVFPKKNEVMWFKYDNVLEKKLALPDTQKMNPLIRQTLLEMNSGEFLKFVETLTGINGLIPDPYFVGGGCHRIESGGHLDLHIDFNYNDKLNLYRRVNIIFYLNENWTEENGGQLDVFSIDENRNALEKKASVLPLFNRALIFETSRNSLHGHTNPVNSNEARKSFALYYYHVEPGEQETSKHSTIFKALPGNNDGLDNLRELRKKGRLEDLTQFEESLKTLK